jgi:hypothetical protein
VKDPGDQVNKILKQKREDNRAEIRKQKVGDEIKEIKDKRLAKYREIAIEEIDLLVNNLKVLDLPALEDSMLKDRIISVATKKLIPELALRNVKRK